MKKIILASTSSRRKMLMEQSGLQFEVVPGTYEEDMTLALTPTELAKTLSRGKAESLKDQFADAIIIGADTFVAYQGKVIGKPHTPEKAIATLTELSGNTHEVITGYTIVDTGSDKDVSKAVVTKVHFKHLSPEWIEEYVATGDPLQKAGSYNLLDYETHLLDRLEGDFNNVIGFPLDDVLLTLKEEFGVAP